MCCILCVFFHVAEKMAIICLEGFFVWAGLVFEDFSLGVFEDANCKLQPTTSGFSPVIVPGPPVYSSRGNREPGSWDHKKYLEP